MNLKQVEKDYKCIVVGGGMAGICAAIAAARHGVKTALIHNRPVLGGNASSEVRMHICGADSHGKRDNARETGIIEEILLENRYRNPHNAYPIFDAILWEKTHFQDNLDLYLNTHMTDVVSEKGHIKSVKAEQISSETVFTFYGDYFCDTTGDGTLAYLAGAEFMSGREAKETFNEPHAPETADHICMGSTLLFKSVDMGRKIPFIKPDWANTYTEADLAHRDHGATGYNYWWIELGGDELDTITDNEAIRDELLKATYGVWDHVKNGGNHQADNYALDWIGWLPGKRESRRIIGDYILTENDLAKSKKFDDAVAYGGWPMDMHIPGGLKTRLEPTDFIQVPDVYQIPFRSLYAKNIDNLYVGGRIISASRMAFGSTRVMATCAVIGQAIGTAVGLMQNGIRTPKDLTKDIEPLQQALLKDDAYIPSIIYDHPDDLAKGCKITASSQMPDAPKENILNGYQRTEDKRLNHWASKKETEPWIQLTAETPMTLKEIRLKFDSDLNHEIRLSMFHQPEYGAPEGTAADDGYGTFPTTLARDYRIDLYNGKNLVHQIDMTDNRYRLRVHTLDQPIQVTAVKVTCLKTYGVQHFLLTEASLFAE